MRLLLMFMFLPVSLTMSFWNYVSPFAWARTIPLAVALLAMVALRKRNPIAVVKLGWWALLTYVADVAAWLVSRRDISDGAGTMRWGSGTLTDAMAGFPLHLLEVPPSPMGGNLPEPQQWWIVFANLAFWALASAGVVFLPRVARRLRFDEFLTKRKNGLWAWVGAFLAHQFGLFLFMIWFD